MDETVRALMVAKNHKAISELRGEEYNTIKSIAAIHLGQYEQALLLAGKNSFEAAYALYKMHRYKRALRILRKMDTEPSRILTSQCLYFLGYYSESHRILSGVSTKDEFAVNLAAMEALDYLNRKNRYRGSLFATEYRGEITSPISPIFTKKETKLEYEYCKVFRDLEDERKFISGLQSLDSDYHLPGCCLDKQIKNLHGEEVIDPGVREAEVIAFNSGNEKSVSDPVHFQRNFIRDARSEYRIVLECTSMDVSDIVSVSTDSEKMRLFKAYFLVRKGAHRRVSILNILAKCSESPLRDALSLLVSRCDDAGEFQRRAIDTILKLKSMD